MSYIRPTKDLHYCVWGKGQAWSLLRVVTDDIMHHQLTVLLSPESPDSNSSPLVDTLLPQMAPRCPL